MPLFDASAALDLWENYPVSQFPKVWDWVEAQVKSKCICVADVAYEEIGHRVPDCKTLLGVYGITRHPIGPSEIQHALSIKSALGIVNDEYSSGVDENDIFIISVAKVHGLDLITNEAFQPSLPTNRARYKIPAVCSLPEAQVKTMRLIEYIRQTGVVF